VTSIRPTTFDDPEKRGSLKEEVTSILRPISPATGTVSFSGIQLTTTVKLPPYYYVYFLFVELLEYNFSGSEEKIAWTIPVEYKGEHFLISHRKFRLGIFAEKVGKEHLAKEISTKIVKAVKISANFFDYLAEKAAKTSKLNVTNNSLELFSRYEFFAKEYHLKKQEAMQQEGKRVFRKALHGHTITFHAYEIKRQSKWLALAAIDAFFSWTEHVFIHIAILNGQITTGEKVAKAATADWGKKFQIALNISDTTSKKHYDNLIEIKSQLRNFITHGAFGKKGEAFQFHSPVGAVPLLLPQKKSKPKYSFDKGLSFDDETALDGINQFINFLWSGAREPAKHYIQESDLPLILTFANDGTYKRAMASANDMEELIHHLSESMDQSINMDF